MLGGFIPPALGLWSNLSMLDISENILVGPVPSEFGKLHNLQVLHLSFNRLNGSLPLELSKCTKLSRLDLSNNLISGCIPKEVVNLLNLQNILLQRNSLTCNIPDSLKESQKLIELQLGDNALEGPIPKSLGDLKQFSLILNLSLNNLSGDIPGSLGNLDKLQVLDLSHNNLTGEIPSRLENMLSLSCVNISCNQLSGKLPPNWIKFAATSPNSFDENPELHVKEDSEIVSSIGKRHGLMLTLIFSIVLFVFGLCVSIYLVYLVRRTCQSPYSQKILLNDNDSDEDLPQDLNFEDIMRVTEDLSEKYVIGRGRHGTVYRTELGYGQLWAVKKLKASERSFAQEMKIMNSVKHKNLIKMDGYCIRDGFELILYEYMPGGTLYDLLHRKPQIALDWNIRYHISLGIAQGLSYLHHDCVPQIIHRDIKASNILMGSELEPKIGDFGMAKVVEESSDAGIGATMSSIIGTLGYIAPGLLFELHTY